MSTTYGIDFAADAKQTATAMIRWDEGRPRVANVQVGCDDADLLALLDDAEGVVGIDCPFGWPARFIDLITRHTAGDLDVPRELPTGWRRDYVLRATDHFVHEKFGLVPLSVAADRIAHPTIRLVALLSHVTGGRPPLDGSGLIAETYPAAALKTWRLPYRRYKGVDGRLVREGLVTALAQAADLDLGAYAPQLVDIDHALDAVVCALVARAVSRRRTWPPNDGELARREGWIHVPRVGLPLS